jgi:hypothetical protein
MVIDKGFLGTVQSASYLFGGRDNTVTQTLSISDNTAHQSFLASQCDHPSPAQRNPGLWSYLHGANMFEGQRSHGTNPPNPPGQSFQRPAKRPRVSVACLRCKTRRQKVLRFNSTPRGV